MTTSVSLIGFRSSRRRRSEIRFFGTVIGSRQCSPLFYNHSYFKSEINITLQLLAMDVSAQVTMKDAAKCDKRCEWQNSANQENVERILHFQVILGSMSSSGLLEYHVARDARWNILVIWYTFLCASDEFSFGWIRWRMKYRSSMLWRLASSWVNSLVTLSSGVKPCKILFFYGMNLGRATRWI